MYVCPQSSQGLPQVMATVCMSVHSPLRGYLKWWLLYVCLSTVLSRATSSGGYCMYVCPQSSQGLPQVMVVSDLEDVFVPQVDGIVCDLSEAVLQNIEMSVH